jgi:hypothetical protein
MVRRRELNAKGFAIGEPALSDSDQSAGGGSFRTMLLRSPASIVMVSP